LKKFKFGKRIGIDLGTANCLVWLESVGVVMSEPTVVAVATDDGRVVAVGNEAREMLGKTPENITALRPLKDGVIADYEITQAMLRYLIDHVCGKSRLFKPEVMICVPAGVTQVERRAVLDATMSAGAKRAYLIDEPLAAAIGAKIPIGAASGSMIIDIGGGSAEAAVISLGGVVVHESVRVGGNKIDESIATYLRRRHNLIIGERMSEEIKLRIGSALVLNPEKTMDVKGRDSISGLPKTITVSSTEITEAISEPLKAIVGAIKGVLEQTPPELSSDIIDKGIVMSGGTSILKNFDKFVTLETGVPAHVAEDPLKCVVYGTGVALEHIDLYKKSITRK